MRLVARGLSSNQIAAERNVRSDSIDRTVLAARQKLDSLPRHDAARRFAEHEAAQQQRPSAPETGAIGEHSPAQSRGAPPLGVPDPTVRVPTDPGEQPGERSDRGLGAGTGDRPAGSQRPAFHQLLFGSDGRLRNDLDIPLSVTAIAIVAAGAACVAVALISLLSALDPYVFGR